jgi:NAD(P)H-dependent flavin oxidoreductase YrpB (nitropropane dioxygenase family)
MKSLQIGDLSVKVPIIQGGMGVAISLSNLAAAVANQGGVGVISAVGIGMNEPDFKTNFIDANIRALRKEIRKAKALTDGVLGVNIMLAFTGFEKLLEAAVEEGIDIVFIGAGLPLKLPDCLLKEPFVSSKTKFVPKVSSPKAVGLIARYWDSKYQYAPDAFVVEGPLAGGHLGFKKNQLDLERHFLPKLVSDSVNIIKPFEEKYNIKIPIIAAGGIFEGKDIYEIMKYGASAVKLGTRFVTTEECDAAPEFKQQFLNCREDDTQIINSPLGLPGRVIRNKFVDDIEAGKQKPFKCSWHCLKTCNFKNVQYCIADALCNAAKGKMGKGFAFAGKNAYRSQKMSTIKDVFDELLTGYRQMKCC